MATVAGRIEVSERILASHRRKVRKNCGKNAPSRRWGWIRLESFRGAERDRTVGLLNAMTVAGQ
jgi:hypothetical protein